MQHAPCIGFGVAHPARADLGALVEALVRAHVDFIVVGGAAAVIHGAPTSTFDLDIVPDTGADNIDRLVRVCAALDAVLRDPIDTSVRPDAEMLARGRQVRLSTSLGPLDSLAVLHDGRTYADLLHHAVAIKDGDLTIRVLDLPTLIQIKSTTGRARDKLLLPILIALSDEQEGPGE